MGKLKKKAILIAAPLLVLGVGVYAFAAEGSSATKTASQSAATNNGVTASVVKEEALTPQEVQQLAANAQPAPATTASTSTAGTGSSSFGNGSAPDQALLDANNPFTVQGAAGTATTTGNAPANSNAGTVGSGSAFDLSLVKDLQIQTNTTQGAMKVQFEDDDKGEIQLTGELGGRKIELKGEQAKQILNQLMQNMNLQAALTDSLQGKQVHLDPSVLQAIQGLHIDMKDGRKIDSAAHGNNPKEQGKHDNGKHLGQEKAKGKEHGKGHGHDD